MGISDYKQTRLRLRLRFCCIYKVLGASLLTQTENSLHSIIQKIFVNTNRKYILSFLFPPKLIPHIFPLSNLSRVYLPNNRSCRGLRFVQNALECTMKWCYIVSQTFFMNLTMENPPWITVHLRLLQRNKLCTWHENKRPETFSLGKLSREIWNRCIWYLCFWLIHLNPRS